MKGVSFLHRPGPLAAKDLHHTNVGAVEVKPTLPRSEPELSKRRGSRGSSSGSSRRVKSVSSRRKKTTKTPKKKTPTHKTPTKKKPGKGTIKKPKKCPAKAPKTCAKNQKDAKGCCKVSQCPKNAPKKCTKKEKDPKTGCCKVSEKLEFTKYPKGKQSWTPPEVKKPAAGRRSVVGSGEPTVIKPEARALDLGKRTSHSVAEGKTVQAGAADSLKTWHVINCIAISAYDSATGKKAMAHINAVSATGKEYDDQFKEFADIVYAWKGPIEVWVRLPHSTAIPEDKKELKPKQKEFENDIKQWVGWMKNSPGPKIKVFERPATKREGDMVMHEEGDVSVE
ncbi:hypothetical protein SLS60_011726 [Paraconiothyrium brasiliense]|uniref:Uncharacterized protein n=1 Tax=Paraconiothyrium brasiliense TaxID=300254 RepID=A0ABR3QHU4_9PLEO